MLAKSREIEKNRIVSENLEKFMRKITQSNINGVFKSVGFDTEDSDLKSMSFKDKKSMLRDRLSNENVSTSYLLKGSTPKDFIEYVKTYVPAKSINEAARLEKIKELKKLKKQVD